MNDLREAAQQAKIHEIAVEQWKLRMVFYDQNGEPLMSRQPEPDEIRADLAQQAEPVEPRRWEGDHNIESPFNACMHKSYCITLKQAPPQRKPLTEEEIERICMTYQSPRQAARAVERAHGITDPQIADRLARHGIPMPEGDNDGR